MMVLRSNGGGENLRLSQWRRLKAQGLDLETTLKHQILLRYLLSHRMFETPEFFGRLKLILG